MVRSWSASPQRTLLFIKNLSYCTAYRSVLLTADIVSEYSAFENHINYYLSCDQRLIAEQVCPKGFRGFSQAADNPWELFAPNGYQTAICIFSHLLLRLPHLIDDAGIFLRYNHSHNRPAMIHCFFKREGGGSCFYENALPEDHPFFVYLSP
jgi:hypothetical protein